MMLPDLNLLIYAVNSDSRHHEEARRWWEGCMNGDEPILLAWVVLLGFLRLSTSPRVFPRPLAPAVAWEILEGWVMSPVTRIVNPGDNHPQILKALTLESGTGGNLTTDAHLAALAIEHSAVLYTLDNDFARFASLKWRNPSS